MNGTMPKINASPTKEFFISILVRDVKLDLAISDLVDNCVDGALRIRSNGNYTGLFVRVKFDAESFSIEDNCGGISTDIAVNYAFRFGRAPGMPETPGSVGQFGVGMKRTLFKIGDFFSILSIYENSDFLLEVDVDEWRTQVDDDGKEVWAFEFKELHTDVVHEESARGTTITVKKIHESIASDFGLENFKLRLIDALRSQHEESLAKGLVIEVNEIMLSHDEASLLYSYELNPIHITKTIELKDKPPVFVEIYAGVVKDSDPDKSGWYISCNGRLILRAEKTRITGWDEEYDSIKTPKAHGQFARFRGYVRFQCADASILPWNTTKSGLDTDTPIYQATKPEMIMAMRQVIDFLNKLDAELDSEDSLLIDSLKGASEVKLSQLPSQTLFQFPTPRPARAKPKESRIAYSIPVERVERAKELLDVTTLKDVGEGTFNYFMQMEDVEDAK